MPDNQPKVLPSNKQNLETIKRAAREGNLCVMACTLKSSDAHVDVLCAAVDYVDGTTGMVPLAMFFTENPYEVLNPPL